MKLGRLITVAAFLASSSAWAGVADIAAPFSVNKVKKLQNTVDFVDGNKIKSEKVNAKDLGPLLCNRDLGKKEEVVAVIPCPVARLPGEGLQLAIYSKDTDQEASDCGRVQVDVLDFIAATDNGDITAISAVAEIDTTMNGIALEWIANVQLDAKVVKKGDLEGFNCTKSANSKSGTGLLDGDPISRVKLEIGNVKGGASQ